MFNFEAIKFCTNLCIESVIYIQAWEQIVAGGLQIIGSYHLQLQIVGSWLFLATNLFAKRQGLAILLLDFLHSVTGLHKSCKMVETLVKTVTFHSSKYHCISKND